MSAVNLRRVLVIALLGHASLLATAQGQYVVKEQITLRGTVESVTPGIVTVRDDEGARHLVRIQGNADKGVRLADGNLLVFPADVQVTGAFDAEKLKAGQVVRFRGEINRLGRTDKEVTELSLIDTDDATVGVTVDNEPKSSAEFAACLVVGAVNKASAGRLLISLPAEQAFANKTLLTFKVAPGTKVKMESRDYKRIDPAAKVVRCQAVRLTTGDIVAQSLLVECLEGVALKARAEDAIAHKYQTLSNVPKPTPRQIRSAHFSFLSDVSDREARIILDKLETMAVLLERYFGRKPAGLVEGFVVHDLKAWPDGMLKESAGVAKIAEKAGICFNARLGKQRQSTLYSCDDHGVIQHECTHGFCHMAFGSTGPTWLAEGVAEMGNYWQEGEQAVAVDSGVMAYLQKASPKRGLLEIAQPGRTPSGTWQDYAWRWALCHMLANNPNYSDRFKPLAIALMEEQGGVSFESVYGPVAKEISFEYDLFLQTVGNGYRADKTAWPWKAKSRPLHNSNATLKATIRSSSGWQSSGLLVTKGVAYQITSDDTWQMATVGTACDADGDVDGRGKLIGVVFSDFKLSDVIPLGVDKTFVAPADGQLLCRSNDAWTEIADNIGSLSITLRRASE